MLWKKLVCVFACGGVASSLSFSKIEIAMIEGLPMFDHVESSICLQYAHDLEISVRSFWPLAFTAVPGDFSRSLVNVAVVQTWQTVILGQTLKVLHGTSGYLTQPTFEIWEWD